MLHEWKLKGKHRNLGDTLSPLLATQEQIKHPTNLYFVIGSVIHNRVIEETIYQGLKPVFINCGWRGDPLDPQLLSLCEFEGARGPNTQRELARHGIHVEVTGDPAYKLPYLIPKAQPNNLRIAVPHIQDPFRNRYLRKMLEVDSIVQAHIRDDEHLLNTIKLISGASFVFAGAMHAAIIAHAYGVPFGLMDNGYVNIPPKWEDWLNSVGVQDISFYATSSDGKEWWNKNVKALPKVF